MSSQPTSAIPLVVWVEPQPASLAYRWYAARRTGISLMQMVLAQLAAMWPGAVVTATTNAEQRFLHDSLRGSAYDASRVVTTSRYTRLAWPECLDHIDGTRGVVFCSPEAILAPALMWRRLAESPPVPTGILLTGGLPERGCPVAFGADALRRVATLDPRNLPPDMAAAQRVIDRAGASRELGLSLIRHSLSDDAGGSQAPIGADVRFETPADADILSEMLGARGEWGYAEFRQRLVRSRRQASRVTLVSSTPRQDGRKRVLFASAPSAFSGGEESLCDLARAVDRSRYALGLIVAHDGMFARRMRDAGVEVFCAERNLAAPTVANHRYAAAVLQAFDPAVAHLNAYIGPALLAAIVDRGVPTVQHVRVPNSEMLAEQIEHAQVTIAVSEYSRRGVLRLGIPDNRAIVVYEGVDLRRFREGRPSRARARRALGIGETTLVILMVARYHREKRHDLALRALVGIRAALPDVQLCFVGDPEVENSTYADVRRLTSELRLSDCVRFGGFHRDIRVPMAAADLLLLPSDCEPLGQAVLQALAMGLPVVVTASGGLAELLEHCPAARLVPPGQAAPVGDAVGALLANNRAVLSRVAVEYAHAHLDIRDHARAIERAWLSAITGTQPIVGSPSISRCEPAKLEQPSVEYSRPGIV